MAAGNKTPWPGYLGRAGSYPPPAGYRSLLAYWLGGASSYPSIEPPIPPTPERGGGGFGYRLTREEKDRLKKDFEKVLRLRQEESEELPLLVAAIWVTIWRD